MIFLFDDADYSIRQAVSVPGEVVKDAAVYNAHVNGHIVPARAALITGPGSTDITSLLRREV